MNIHRAQRITKEQIECDQKTEMLVFGWRTLHEADGSPLKLQITSGLVKLRIDCYKGSVEITNLEYCGFVRILKFAMSVTADKWGLQPLEYVSIMGVLWGLIALNKYQCIQLELNDMLKALDFVHI